LALNFVGYREGPRAEASRAVARTLRVAFGHVHAFADADPAADPDVAGNIIFFASDGPLTFAIPEDVRGENPVCGMVLRSFLRWEVLLRALDGPAITDARNPLGRMQLPIAEEHFDAMNKLLPAEAWLY